MVLSLGKLKFLARWMVNVVRFRMIQDDEGDEGDESDFHVVYWGAGAGAGAGAGYLAMI